MTVWRLEWQEALGRRRLFIWNVVVPLLLLGPVALSEAAAPHRVAVFGVFFVFFATFGSAIPVVRDARDGWLDEVFRAGYAPGRWVAERALAGAAIDLVQLLPTLGVLLVSTGALDGLGWALAGLAGALLFANILGPALGALVRSLAEAALVCAAVSLLLLHLAGFFRTPRPGWTLTAATWNPYAPLRDGLGAAFGGPAVELGDQLFAVTVIALFLGAAVGSAGGWTRRFRWPFR